MPVLVGTTGPWAGKQFDIGKSRMLVGGAAPADIVLDDDSVSRKHAEILLSGSQATVRDLGSGNGTFVNGERIREFPLLPGDSVRFGSIDFSYSGPRALRAGNGSRMKSVLLLLGGVLLLLAGLPPAARAASPAVDTKKMLGLCAAYADIDSGMRDWNRCIEVCSQIVEDDPTQVEARQQLSFCRKELASDNVIAEARLKSSTGQDEAAVKLLLQVDRNATSYGEARRVFKEAAERLGKRKRTDCKTEFHSGDYQKAYDECQRFFEVTCGMAGWPNSEILGLLQKSAAMTGRPKEPTCPPAYRRMSVNWDPPPEPEPAEPAIRRKYPGPVIAEGMVAYFKEGRPKQVSDEFKRQRIKQPRLKEQLDELVFRLDLMDGRYTSGMEGIVKNDPRLAERYWREAFATDKLLMPPGVSSALVRDMKTQLAAAYARVAGESMKKDHAAEAFAAYIKGYGYDPQNTEILTSLRKGEQTAKKMLDAGGCENATEAAAYTLDTSAFHKRALKYLEENGCR